jgi:hypothetical protein
MMHLIVHTLAKIQMKEVFTFKRGPFNTTPDALITR